MVLDRRAQGARDRALPPGQVPRREARQAAGGEAREHVRADGRGRARRRSTLIIKADVQGSHEALTHALTKLVDRRGQGQHRARRRRRHHRVGRQPGDRLASAVIIGFNTRADAAARKLAEDSGVQIRYYNIIYEAVDEMKAALSGMLAPEKQGAGARPGRGAPGVQDLEGRHGRRLLRASKAWCKRGAQVRVLRDNVVIHNGELDSLKRFKDDVREVQGRLRVRHVAQELQRHQGEATRSRSSRCVEVARTL